MTQIRDKTGSKTPNLWKQGFLSRHGNIAVYVPNLIGYARVACSFAAFAVAPTRPVACIVLYFFSFVCDELDGRAARAFNQSSTLGAVLDMLTDRLSTAGLLVLLCIRYPAWYLAFLSLMFLDIFSHWLQMYSSLVAGDISHKETHNQSWLVRYYYTHRIFMGFCCVCCEVLYLAIYVLGWQQLWGPQTDMRAPTGDDLQRTGGSGDERHHQPLILIIAVAAAPGFLVKQLINVAQIRAAVNSMILLDRQRDEQQAEKAQ